MSTDHKPSKNEDEYFAREDAELLKQQRSRTAAERIAAERKSHFMKCPKCGYDLHTETLHGVPVEGCPNCHGLWLDAGELDAVLHHKDPGLLDRVFGDMLTSLRGRGRQEGASR